MKDGYIETPVVEDPEWASIFEPDQDEQEEVALKRYGCDAQKESVYLTYESPGSLLRISKTRKLSKRKLKKLILGNLGGLTPLQIRH